MSPSVVCYPQPGKAKSLMVLEAFATGCGVATGNWPLIHHGQPAELEVGGAAAFYGVVGIERLFYEARDGGRDWYYADNSYFDCVRQSFFRVHKNGLQASTLMKPNYDRLRQLGLEIKPWRRDGRHIVVVMQSPHFMSNVATWSGGSDVWQEKTLLALKQHTDRPIVVRHWNRDKAERARSLQQDLEGAWALVTHMSAAANEAVLAGVPVFVTGPCAALPMGLSQVEQIETPRRPDGRQEWAAGLAARQWSLDEMRQGIAWRTLQ